MDTSGVLSEDVLLIVDNECICRLCLRSGGALSDIFDEQIDSKIIENIALFASIHIKPDDNLPMKICHRCRYMTETCSEFKSLILDSNRLLLQSLSGDNLSNIANEKNIDNSFEIDYMDKCIKREESLLFNKSADDPIELYNEENLDTFIEDGENIEITSSRLKKKLKKETDDISDQNVSSRALSIKDFPNQLKCMLCLQVCKDITSLNNHIYMHVKDTNLEPYNILGESNITCKPCNKNFNYRYSFLDHQREHLNLKPFPCLHHQCGSEFSSKSLLRQHEAMHADRNFICSTCAVAFKRKSELTAHEKIHEDEGKRFECPICGFLCKTRFTRAAHLKNHKKIRKYKCSKCPKTFFSPSQLRTHELVHFPEKRYSCDQCTSKYYSSSALARHLKVRHSTEWAQHKRQKPILFNMHSSDVTNESQMFDNESFQIQELDVTIANSISETVVCVDKLDNVRDSNKRRYAHEINSRKKIINTSNEKPKECLLCLEVFKDQIDLFKHIDDHVEGTSLEPYYKLAESDIVCKCCERKFNYRYNFLIHQREYLNLKPFHCKAEGCDLSFHSKSLLRYHMPVHNNRSFICSVCSTGFNRKADLVAHEIIHEDADIKYECPICGLECKTRFTKALHLKKHQNRQKFKCASCPKEYFSKSQLLTHEIVHLSNTSLKPFPCNQCKSAYLSRKSLIRHKRDNHGIDEECEKHECPLCKQIHSPICDDILKRHSLEPNYKEISYQCSCCTDGFYEEECFNKHIELCFTNSYTINKGVISTLSPNARPVTELFYDEMMDRERK